MHASEQAWAHLGAELRFETVGDVESVVATLVEEGPYSFTSGGRERPAISDGARYEASVAVTREGVFKHYSWVHGTYSIDGFDPMIEIRGNWYTFFESITTLGVKATGETTKMINLVLLASGAGKGITGEISWHIDPRGDSRPG